MRNAMQGGRAAALMTCSALALVLGAPIAAAVEIERAEAGDAALEANQETQSPPGQPTQEADAPIERIVITARRREETIRDVPASVSLVGGESLENRALTDLRALEGTIPNVSFQAATTSATSAQIYVRGVGIDPPLYTVDGSIGIYMNDVFIGRPSGSLTGGALDLDRVEVLRGPQGTLYGRNAVAGAIRFITRAPELGVVERNLSVTVGSEDRRDIRGVFNAPLGENAAIRVAAQTRDASGYYNLVDEDGVLTGDTANGTRAQDARISLHWRPSAQTTVDIVADYSRDRSGPQVITPLDCASFGLNPQFDRCPFFYGDPYTGHYSFPHDANRFDGGGVAGTVEWELSDAFSLKSVTSYRGFNEVFTTTLSGRPSPRTDISQDLDQSQFTQEFQLSSNLDGPINFIGGLYFFREDIDAVSLLETAAVSIENRDDQTTTSTALFGEVYYRPIEDLEITVGARYTWEERENDRQLIFGAGSLHSAKISEEIFTPKLGISYDTGPALLYATYSQGFRPGGWSTATPTSPSSQAAIFELEEMTAYEIGLRSELLDNRLALNLAAFRNEYNNLQATRTNELGETIVVSSDAQIDGFEAEFSYRATDQLRIFGNLGLMSNKYLTPPPGLPFAVNLKHAPDAMGMLGFNYDWELDQAPGSFFVGGEWAHVGSSFRNVANSETLHSKPYDLVSARIGYRSQDDRWSLTFGGTNLLDETYFMIGAEQPSAGYSAPRRFHLTLDVSF